LNLQKSLLNKIKNKFSLLQVSYSLGGCFTKILCLFSFCSSTQFVVPKSWLFELVEPFLGLPIHKNDLHISTVAKNVGEINPK
jgi:hypothetical protein